MLLGFIIIALPPIAVVSALIYLPYLRYFNRRYGKRKFSYHFAKYTLIGYCISLVYLTILWQLPGSSFPPEHYFLNLRPFVWLYEVYDMGVKKMTQQLLLNIGMFIPYGLLLPLAVKRMRSFRKVALTVLCSTVAIETIQYFLGRSADIDDVIMNLTGGLLGYLFYTFLARRAENQK